MINRDLSVFIYENNNYTEIIEENASTDIAKIIKETKEIYEIKLDNFYKYLYNNQYKDAKKECDEIIRVLEKAKSDIKNIKEESFTDKMCSNALHSLYELGNIFFSVLKNFAVSLGLSIIATATGNFILKQNKKITKTDAALQGIETFVMSAPEILRRIMNEKKAIESREKQIKETIKRDHTTRDIAEEKVGTLYKTAIIDYLDTQIKAVKKLKVNVKVDFGGKQSLETDDLKVTLDKGNKANVKMKW